ncbi:MAG: sugar transferase [Thermoflexales bacterium]|nr:sugar transferase [Thermoflexales bacterium]
MMSPTRPSQLLSALAVDVLLTLAALSLASELRPLLPIGRPLKAAWLDWPVYLLAALIWSFTLAHQGLYTTCNAALRAELRTLATSITTALLLFAGALYLSFREISRLQFLLFGALDFAFLTTAHFLRWAMQKRSKARWSVIIVGATPAGRAIAQQLQAGAPRMVQVIGFVDDTLSPNTCPDGLPVLGANDELPQLIKEREVAEVIIALPRSAHEQLLKLVTELETLPVQISLVPDVLDLAWFTTHVENVNGVPLLRLRHSPLDDGLTRVVKRLMDLVIASVMVILTAPIMVLLALLIRLDSPGPALIKQQRVGEGGRLFEMYKFRTMHANAPQQLGDGFPYKRPDDPRVTRLGRILRRYSLDELPQLFNVLKGEMSLVGPRPELPWLVERYQPWQRRRFAVPPGMTGWWQINGRSERPMHEHVEDDLYYIRNYSLWLDLFILLRTVPAVLSGRGAF